MPRYALIRKLDNIIDNVIDAPSAPTVDASLLAEAVPSGVAVSPGDTRTGPQTYAARVLDAQHLTAWALGGLNHLLWALVYAAAADGAILLKQDLNLLENIVPLGVARYFELIEQGRFHPSEVDWLVCHYSSHMFRGKIIELLEKGGAMIPEERWFTNLYTKGNTGAASLFIMLEELFNERELKPGQKILCMVPESGRFVVSFLQLTVVGSERATLPAPATQSDVQAEAQAARHHRRRRKPGR